jgi:YD repeat-containing protein
MFVALTSCASPNHPRSTQAPSSSAPVAPAPVAPAPVAPAPVAPHTTWRPLHKGYADLSTGVYIREDDDLVVPTPFPIVLRRTYNSGDGHSRQFGIDATHPGEWWLHGDNDPRVPWAELILADGGRIRFTRISPGDTRDGAVLTHNSTPTEFNGALLSWTGSTWQLRLRDGSTASFMDCDGQAQMCSLIESRDPDGHTITFARDASGLLLRMESEGQSIAFDYDDQKRIIRAFATSQNEVRYDYDDAGRLIHAAMSDGTVRRYAYDSRNYLVRIEEPGRIVENRFDESGRWAYQTVKDSENDPDPYVAIARYVVENGVVVETDFDEGDGLEVSRYNAHGYIVSETLFANSSTPVTFRYLLDSSSNVASGAAMSCTSQQGPVTRDVRLTVHDDTAKALAIRANCVLRR